MKSMSGNAAAAGVRPASLSPPFLAKTSLVDVDKIVLPALVRREQELIRPEHDPSAFLSGELCTRRLNALHKYLWLAALPVPSRSLARQKLLNRTLLSTERPDEHLVWHQNRIFLKPLPGYLLSHAFWEQHLCGDAALHRSACGFLLSYMWLVSYPADFLVARDSHLIPEGIDYQGWVRFSRDFLGHINLETLEQVDKRYQYGELRLTRLNHIIKYVPSELWSTRTFVDGFMSTSTWYTVFFQRNFGWLLVVFAYISIVLSSLQLGVATDLLGGSVEFQTMSSALTYASLAAVVASTVSVFVVWFVLFWFHLLTTKQFAKRAAMKRRKARQEKA